MTDRGQIGRLLLIGLVFVAVFVALGSKISTLHLGANERLRERVVAVRHVEQPLRVGRGRIFDRNGQILAMDLTVNDICVDPASLAREGYMEFAVQHLSRTLHMDRAAVQDRVDRPARRFEYVRRGVPDDEAAELKALKLPSRMVWFEPVSQRHYPLGIRLCHVIGFTNLEGAGNLGVEQVQNRFLRGRPGVRISQRDGRGREMRTRRSLEIEAREGADVVLTVDSRLQEMVETSLDEALVEHQAIAVWAVVQKVQTGEILAMASRPAFDLNAYRDSSGEARRNRCLATIYEPGSTFKVPVLAACYNEGLVKTEEVIDCENGAWFHRGRLLRDYSPHGLMTVPEVIKKSSNIGAAKIGLRMNPAVMERYLRAFGFGRATGIDLPGEQAGILRSCAGWSGLSQSRISIGHEISATALQVLNAVCAVANRGRLMKPAIVRQIVDANGGRLYEFKPEVVSQPIREETAQWILPLLARVTEPGGTGARAALEGYTVAGKTGTAQKSIAGGYSDRLNFASFVGVLPAQDPQIGIIVVVDEPKPLRTGGAVAAPVFRKIAERAVRVLDIPAGPTPVTPEIPATPAGFDEEEAGYDSGSPL
jgi:cell division protein FtsI (penicillin-binding protein 3)